MRPHAQVVFASPLLRDDWHDLDRQKALIIDTFSGLGWHIPSLLDGLRQASGLYFDSISRVSVSNWVTGRIALLGDAAWGVTLGGRAWAPASWCCARNGSVRGPLATRRQPGEIPRPIHCSRPTDPQQPVPHPADPEDADHQHQDARDRPGPARLCRRVTPGGVHRRRTSSPGGTERVLSAPASNVIARFGKPVLD